MAVVGLIVNLVSVRLLGGDHDHHEQETHEQWGEHADHNLKAAYLHVLADAMTSVLAIIALAAGIPQKCRGDCS